MAGSRITVGAGMRATPIRIHAVTEGDVGAVVLGDDATRGFPMDAKRLRQLDAVFPFHPHGLEPVSRVRLRTDAIGVLALRHRSLPATVGPRWKTRRVCPS